MTYRKDKPKRDIYQEVTDSIVRQIEAGLNGGWKRPWRTVAADGSSYFPVSINGRSYRGANTIILLSEAQAKGYPVNVWATYRAWQAHDAQVRKGERGTLVTLWKFLRIKDEKTDKEKTVPLIRGFTVFNASQVDNWEKPAAPAQTIEERHEKAHEMLRAYLSRENVDLQTGGDRACYSSHFDVIRMPVRQAFKDEESYLATLAHEQGHSTGHEKRLDRQLGNRFGSHAYAAEELIAELSSAMVMASLGVELPECIDSQHAKYVRSWLDVLKADKRAIFHAASKAQHAADLILNQVQAKPDEIREAA